MTCKDCIHYDVCVNKNIKNPKECNEYIKDLNNMEKVCKSFKDKSKYIELPCNIGDMVYHIIREIEVTEESIYQVRIYEDKHIAFSASRKGGRIVFREEDIGKTVFLTKEHAEAKLKTSYKKSIGK